jgi:lipid-binding SYLF domain-containing protein
MKNASPLYLSLALVACSLPSQAGLFSPKGDSPQAKRQVVLKQREEMMGELYRTKPELKERLQAAAGYATFRQTDLNLFLLASGRGYGAVHDNKTGKDTFMSMASLGAGIGLGVKDLRVIFIFKDAKVMHQFVDEGWQFAGKGDVSAKYQDTGISAEAGGKANVNFKDGTMAAGATSDTRASTEDQKAAAAAATRGGMEIYQFTESGLSLQATVQGTKYWKDSKLNQ